MTREDRIVLQVANLHVRIPLRGGNIVHAVSGVSLKVRRGEILAVIGESGCGKSVIASAIVGTLPHHARVKGSVRFYPNHSGEKPLEILSRRRRHAGLTPTDSVLAGRRIALVPQSAATFLTPVRTVGSQLAETIEVLESEYSIAELLQRVSLDENVAQMYPHELSGGMAQRAAVAFALVGEPDIIIADEPTAALDPKLTVQLLELLRTIADNNVGVMLITHDISELRDSGIADHIAVMYASQCEEEGPAETVLHNPGSAYMRDLLAALPENGMCPMPGAVPSLTNLPEGYCYERRLEEAQLLISNTEKEH